MIVPKTIQDLQRLIDDNVEESQQLEYKAAQALQNITVGKDIAKDVSAMANASGGVIIYGIKEYNAKEKKHLPESITPIQRAEFSKERLEQLINSNISPKIEGITIHPIALNESEVVYVVGIPQSHTAHQSTKDYLYYRRYNFEILPMQDYEIRDVMNRLKHPRVRIDFELIKQESRNNSTLTLRIIPVNEGNQYAQYINYFIEIPRKVIHSESSLTYSKTFNDTVELYGENTVRDLLEYDFHSSYTKEKRGAPRYVPILPGLSGKVEIIKLKNDIRLSSYTLNWRVYADNAPVNSGSIRMSDIEFTSN